MVKLQPFVEPGAGLISGDLTAQRATAAWLAILAERYADSPLGPEDNAYLVSSVKRGQCCGW